MRGMNTMKRQRELNSGWREHVDQLDNEQLACDNIILRNSSARLTMETALSEY